MLEVVAAAIALARGPVVESVTPRGATVSFITRPASTARVDLSDGRVLQSPRRQVHVLRVGALVPGRRYTYRVAAGGRELARGRFRAAPDGADRFSFAVVGDYGNGSQHERDVVALMRGWRPDFVLTTGDNNYPLGLAEHMDRTIFTPYRPLMREAAFFPSLGNHDVYLHRGAPYLEAFHLPGAERWYRFRWGQAAFTVLDSTTSTAASTAQGRFLRAALPLGACFRFAAWHHPPWSAHSEGIAPMLRRNVVPAVAAARVDVVFVGHVHSYERSVPQAGVTYVSVGTGGAEIGRVGDSSIPFARAVRGTYGALRVDVDGRGARFRFYAVRGRVLDDWTRTCPARTR